MTGVTLRRAWPLAGALLAGTLMFSGCTVDNSNGDSDTSGEQRKLTVSASDDVCKISANRAPAGTITFEVTNNGSKVTEFYLLGEDGQRVVGEVENVGPGLTRNLVVQATPGSYVTACKPGMAGKGIRDTFTVTGGSTASNTADDTAVRQATDAYAAYVREQSEQLLQGTRRFAKAYGAHRDE
jgi:iron uptake system component EfeO